MKNNYIEGNPFQTFNAQAGSMLLHEIVTDKDFEVAILIKEETKYITRYPNKLDIELRLGMFRIDNVMVVPVMLLINNDYEMLYESYFNYYAEGNKRMLNLLQSQDDLHLLFFDEQNEKARAVKFKNTIKDEIKEINMRLSSTKSWSMNEFDIAKEKSYELYPTPEYLWRGLNGLNL
jgi:hypothetical protein